MTANNTATAAALPAASTSASEIATPPSSKRGVRWGTVEVRCFQMTLDSSKLPSDGLAPLGLGLAIDEAREHTTVDIFEQRLRTGVHPIPASMRRQLAAAGDASNASHPTGELERIEAENVSLLSVPLYACERDEEEMPVGSKRAANGLAALRILHQCRAGGRADRRGRRLQRVRRRGGGAAQAARAGAAAGDRGAQGRAAEVRRVPAVRVHLLMPTVPGCNTQYCCAHVHGSASHGRVNIHGFGTVLAPSWSLSAGAQCLGVRRRFESCVTRARSHAQVQGRLIRG